ncbi:MAG TPA: hypothetical protein VKQ28_14610 [Candidatus Acidoferrum sp.]|nr:hypothetical protein [Candidatus Acidoferrum sp.]
MNAPRCGVHIAMEMALVESKPPSWIVHPDGADETGQQERSGCVNRKLFTRKSWKCPVPGCIRVAAYAPTEEEEKDMAARPCSGCGRATTARVYCAACLKEYNDRRNAARRAKRASREGLGKGFYAGAKARRLARSSAAPEQRAEREATA